MYFHFMPEENTTGKTIDTYRWALVHKKYHLYLCKDILQTYSENPDIPVLIMSKKWNERLKERILKKSKIRNLNKDDFYLVGGLV